MVNPPPSQRKKSLHVVPFSAAGRADRWLDAWLKPAVVALLAAAAVYALTALPLRRERASLAREIAGQSERIRALESSIERGGELMRLLGSKDVVVAPLAGPEPDAWGRIVWDRAGGLAHVYAPRLDPALPGRAYALWLVTEDQNRIRVGSLEADPPGTGFFVARVPKEVRRAVGVEVTDEPAVGGAQPTGKVRLSATLP